MNVSHTELNAIATGAILLIGLAALIVMQWRRPLTPTVARPRLVEIECALLATMAWAAGTLLFYLGEPNGSVASIDLLTLDLASGALATSALLLGWGSRGLIGFLTTGRWRLVAGAVLLTAAWNILLPRNATSGWFLMIALAPSQAISAGSLLLFAAALLRRFAPFGVPLAIAAASYGLLHLPAYYAVFIAPDVATRELALDSLALGKACLLGTALFGTVAAAAYRCQSRRVQQQVLLWATCLGAAAAIGTASRELGMLGHPLPLAHVAPTGSPAERADATPVQVSQRPASRPTPSGTRQRELDGYGPPPTVPARPEPDRRLAH